MWVSERAAQVGLAQINAWLADLPSRWTVSHDVRHGPDPVQPSPGIKRIIRDFAGAVCFAPSGPVRSFREASAFSLTRCMRMSDGSLASMPGMRLAASPGGTVM
jgi:hypothetical protein